MAAGLQSPALFKEKDALETDIRSMGGFIRSRLRSALPSPRPGFERGDRGRQSRTAYGSRRSLEWQGEQRMLYGERQSARRERGNLKGARCHHLQSRLGHL